MKCKAQVHHHTNPSYHDCARPGAHMYADAEGTRIPFCSRHVSRAESHGMKRVADTAGLAMLSMMIQSY